MAYRPVRFDEEWLEGKVRRKHQKAVSPYCMYGSYGEHPYVQGVPFKDRLAKDTRIKGIVNSLKSGEADAYEPKSLEWLKSQSGQL